jgi:hypothetical protein
LLSKLPASQETHIFVLEDISDAFAFQTEAQKLGFHSILHIYSSPDMVQAAPIFAVVGGSKQDISHTLQQFLHPNSHTLAACSKI